MTTDAQAAAPAAVTDPAVTAYAPDLCSRRALLRRAGVGGALVGSASLLAACGGSGGSTSTAGSGEGSGSSSGGGSSVAASQVPEGSAVVVDAGGEKVVLAQPSAGEYVAYSAVCTHAGGIVQADSGTVVRCPLHGSQFDVGDGAAVLEGPATTPLGALTVSLEGDQLVIS